jgi:hypothetical protein
MLGACIRQRRADLLEPLCNDACATFAECARFYHTNNFVNLCDLGEFLPAMLPETVKAQYRALLITLMGERYQELMGTLTARYVHGNTQQPVHKEFFDVVRCLKTLWRMIPNFDQAQWASDALTVGTQLAQVANGALDMRAPIEDDAELVEYPLQLLRDCVQTPAFSPQNLRELLFGAVQLPDLLLRLLDVATDQSICSFALALLHDMLMADASILPNATLDRVLNAIATVFRTETAQTHRGLALQSDAALTVFALSRVPPASGWAGAANLPQAMIAVAQNVRGDAMSVPQVVMAQCVGIFCRTHASTFTPQHISSAIQCVRTGEKDMYSADATVGFAQYIISAHQAGMEVIAADRTSGLLVDFGRLVDSWHEVITHYPEARQAVATVLHTIPNIAPSCVSKTVLPLYR